MRSQILNQPVGFAGFARWCSVLAMAGSAQWAFGQTVLPPDVQVTCPVPPADLAKWFANGTVQPNGPVLPADSVNFTSASNPIQASPFFYKWAEQMFLWYTSPTPDGGHIFDSPVFYDVSPEQGGSRTLTQNTGGAAKVRKFGVRVQKAGPEGLEMVRTPDGKRFLKSPQSERLLKKSGAAALLPTDAGETGQATGDALISVNGSLVYYAVQVNDVYAYFLTGQKLAKFNPAPANFPINATDLAQIVALAQASGQTLPDANALAIETKSSWVDASTVADASKFITIQGEVPDYNRTNPNLWTYTGTSKTIKLALVGVHIVGTVANHPEMVWATFEHNLNAPFGAYAYTQTGGGTGNVAQNTAGNWLFCKSGSAGPFNKSLAALVDQSNPGGIKAKTTAPIGPSDTLLTVPWGGSSADTQANPPTTVNNTFLVSLNASIQAQLSSDVRTNYLQIGAVWTGSNQPAPLGNPPYFGSPDLANSTMETYFQGSGSNCFDCHSGNPFGQQQLSHIYFETKALDLSAQPAPSQK